MRGRPARTPLFALGLVFSAALGLAQDKPQAIEIFKSYSKALELNPGNRNAAEKLNELRP